MAYPPTPGPSETESLGSSQAHRCSLGLKLSAVTQPESPVSGGAGARRGGGGVAAAAVATLSAAFPAAAPPALHLPQGPAARFPAVK